MGKVAKKNTARKNTVSRKKSTKSFKFELGFRGVLYLGVFIFLAMLWSFILGVFIGRGYNPEDYVPELTKVMPLQDSAHEQKDVPETLRPEELDFLERLTQPDNEDDVPAVPEKKEKVSGPVKKETRKEPVKKERQSKNRFEYIYQVSAFKDLKRAEKLQSKLVQAGISASVTKAYAGSQQWYRVFVNFKGTESQAVEIKKELHLLGIDKPFLKSKKASTDY